MAISHDVMGWEKLIAKQQLEVESLKEKIKITDDCRKKIFSVLYSTGGPLNDNILGYSKEQMEPFMEISEILNL